MATPETENGWLEKCRKLSNGQLEREVRKELPRVLRFLSPAFPDQRTGAQGSNLTGCNQLFDIEPLLPYCPEAQELQISTRRKEDPDNDRRSA